MPEITGVAHVELSVRDLDASSAWYCELLGAREVFRARNEPEHLEACALLEPKSGMVLALTRHDETHPGEFTPRRAGLDHLAFAVDEPGKLAEWATRLDELGIEHSPIRDYGYATAITFRDPDGIALELFCPAPGRRQV